MPIRSHVNIAKGKLRRSGFANEVPNRQKIRQKVGQKGNFMERDYEEIFQKVLESEQKKNQDRSEVHLDRAPVFPGIVVPDRQQ